MAKLKYDLFLQIIFFGYCKTQPRPGRMDPTEAFRDPFVASNLVRPNLRAERYVGPRISLGPNRLRSNQAFLIK